MITKVLAGTLLIKSRDPCLIIKIEYVYILHLFMSSTKPEMVKQHLLCKYAKIINMVTMVVGVTPTLENTIAPSCGCL